IDRIGAIAAKEFIHIRRDPRMIIAVLLLPLIQLLLFAYAISFDVRNIPAVVVDLDKTSASREYVEAFRNSGFFEVRGSAESVEGAELAFESGTARAAVVVAPGFADSLARDEKAAVQVLLDGSEANSAQLGQAYAIALNSALDQQALASFAERENVDTGAFGRLEPRVRTWYNPERRSADFLVPGLLVVIVMIVTVQQTAVTLVRERDQGTLGQMIVSPMRRWELMVGKLLPWAIMGLLDTIAIILAAILLFRVPLRGDILLLVVSMFVFIIASLALGLIISARSKSIESANMVALLVSFLPAFLLSGFAFPLNSVPWVLQLISYLFPGRYMIAISRAVFLKGASWAEMWPQVLALTVYSMVAIGIASLLYRRRTG
ncbi:MAG: ABC transporter permease, partial [Coriobacteriales bacterium]|nr:ABC transporter permease [Coriobacteriales bacterium]